MALADANRVALRGIKEVTWGVTPAVAFNNIRYNKHSLGAKRTYITSNELRSDRQRSDTIQTGGSTEGDFEFELSYGGTGANNGNDYFMEGALQSTWSSALTVTGTNISCASGDNSINHASSGFPAFVVGQWIVVKGFTTNGSKFFGKVVTATSAKVTLTGVTLTTEAAGASVTVASDANIRNGTTATSYVLESDFADLGSTFFTHNGMRVGGMAINAASGAIITGSYSFMGGVTTVNASSQGTGAAVAAPTNQILSAQSHIGALYEGTTLTPVSGVFFKKFDFNLANNLRNQEAVANLYPVGIGSGTVDVTMDIDAYFSNTTLYNKFLNATATGLALRLDGADGGSYVLEIPRVKFTQGDVTPGGINTDIMVSMKATAYLHPTLGYTVQITKLPF